VTSRNQHDKRICWSDRRFGDQVVLTFDDRKRIGIGDNHQQCVSLRRVPLPARMELLRELPHDPSHVAALNLSTGVKGYKVGWFRIEPADLEV